MQSVKLYNLNGKESSTAFIKVDKTEIVTVDNNQAVIVKNDKNFQITSVVGHPELNYLIGRPFLLCIQEIKEACRHEEV